MGNILAYSVLLHRWRIGWHGFGYTDMSYLKNPIQYRLRYRNTCSFLTLNIGQIKVSTTRVLWDRCYLLPSLLHRTDWVWIHITSHPTSSVGQSKVGKIWILRVRLYPLPNHLHRTKWTRETSNSFLTFFLGQAKVWATWRVRKIYFHSILCRAYWGGAHSSSVVTASVNPITLE